MEVKTRICSSGHSSLWKGGQQQNHYLKKLKEIKSIHRIEKKCNPEKVSYIIQIITKFCKTLFRTNFLLLYRWKCQFSSCLLVNTGREKGKVNPGFNVRFLGRGPCRKTLVVLENLQNDADRERPRGREWERERQRNDTFCTTGSPYTVLLT